MPNPTPRRNPFPELGRQAIIAMLNNREEIVPGAGVFMMTSQRTASVTDLLTRKAIESLRQAAGINRAVDLPLQSSIVEDQTAEIKAALSQASPVLSGALAASWLNGQSSVTPNGDGTYTLNSSLPYARINDLGGDTGKNHASHISPSYYVASAESAAGLESGALQWVDGRLSGASGVGARGFDRPAANPLGGISLRRAA